MDKICSTCKVSKTDKAFYKNKETNDGLSYKCKECSNEYVRLWAKKNLDKKKEYRRNWLKKNPGKEKEYSLRSRAKIQTYGKNYGVSDEFVLELKNRQNNACAICKVSFDGMIRRFSIDHCHKSHKVRGLLCGHCNQGLGNFKDNPELLVEAIKYLQKTLDK